MPRILPDPLAALPEGMVRKGGSNDLPLNLDHRHDPPAPFLARDGQTGQIFSIPFAFGQKVNIDGHTDIKAIVTGFAFYPHNSEVRVEWFANGDAKLAWIGAGRLTLAQ